jgi:hypothetical protein
MTGNSVSKSASLVSVWISIRGDHLNPGEATSLLGTSGTNMRSRGEKWMTPGNQEASAKTGVWTLDPNLDSQSLSDQISYLKDKLSHSKCFPMKIPGVQAAEITVFIALGSNDHGGGDYSGCFSHDDLVWLANLGLPVSFALTYVEDAIDQPTES